MEREAVLMKIKAAEKEAATRREQALRQAAAIKEKAVAEASAIVASAEKEGRKMMKDALDSARAEEERKRAERLAEADRLATVRKEGAAARKPQVIRAVEDIFAREFDVQD